MNGNLRIMKRAISADTTSDKPPIKFIKLMKYHTFGSSPEKALLSAAGFTKSAMRGTTKDITNVNNEAITVNNINLSCAPLNSQPNTKENAFCMLCPQYNH